MSAHSKLPDPRIEAAAPVLRERVDQAAATLASQPALWAKVFDRPLARLFDLHLSAIGASEGTIWAHDAATESLVPVHNNGPKADGFVRQYRQPLSRGIISTVFFTQRGLSEAEVYRNAKHDSAVNELQGNITAHMIAVPWFVGDEPAGIVSAVKLKAPQDTDPPPFDVSSFDTMGALARITGEMIAARLFHLILDDRLP